MNRILIVLFALVASLVGCSSLIAGKQYEALMELYKLTSGPGWSNSNGWGANNTYCSWFGVGCDKDSNVESLKLDSNNLQGYIPDTIGDLNRLQILSMEDNVLSGPIPNSIGKLTNLRVVKLNQNYLSGTIPDLSKLINLQSLGLRSNQLTGSLPTSISYARNLTNLGLESNFLTGTIPTSFSNLNNLISIGLNNNSLSGTIPNWIGGSWQTVKQMTLGVNQFTGTIPESIYNLKNLGFLELYSNLLSGTIPDIIMKMPMLVGISLGENQFTGTIPKPNPKIQRRLVSISLPSNQLSGTIPEEFSQLRLTILNLSNNMGLTGTISEALVNMPNLSYLKLAACSFTGTLPQTVGSALEFVHFENNQLTGTLPAWDAQQMEELYLGGNQFTGTMPESYGDMSLFKIGLENNLLTGTNHMPEQWFLVYCNFSGNPFKCPVPSWMKTRCGATCE